MQEARPSVRHGMGVLGGGSGSQACTALSARGHNAHLRSTQLANKQVCHQKSVCPLKLPTASSSLFDEGGAGRSTWQLSAQQEQGWPKGLPSPPAAEYSRGLALDLTYAQNCCPAPAGEQRHLPGPGEGVAGA